MSTASLTPPIPAGDLTELLRAIVGSLVEKSFEIVIDVGLVCKIAGMSADAIGSIGVRGAQAFQATIDFFASADEQDTTTMAPNSMASSGIANPRQRYLRG
jgi:hypothetical protein